MRSLVYNHGQSVPSQPFSYIDIGSINNIDLCLNEIENIIQAKDAPSRARRIVEMGDILYSTVRPYLHNMCIVDRIFSAIPIASTGFAVMACYPGVVNSYLFLYLQSPQFDQYANDGDNAKGVAYPAINDEKLYKALIPVPPKNEQNRIVEFISTIQPSLNRYNSSQRKIDDLNRGIKPMLRKSILQEAIQGKLVPQEPKEKPATFLLEQIREEKQKLLREGLLKKKDLVDSVIFKGEDNKYYEKVDGNILDISEEISFEIPNSWQWIRLGTLFSHNTGKALNRADTDGIKKKYLTTSNVYWNRFDFKEVREMFFTDPELEKCTVHKGDLLVCEGGDIGRSAIWQYDEEICIQNHIHRLRAYYPINTEFYYLVFYHYKNIGNIGGKGIGIQGLSSGALHRLIVPLPPIEEQYRITHKYNSLIASIMRKSTAEVLK